jgi:hypothetical protein
VWEKFHSGSYDASAPTVWGPSVDNYRTNSDLTQTVSVNAGNSRDGVKCLVPQRTESQIDGGDAFQDALIDIVEGKKRKGRRNLDAEVCRSLGNVPLQILVIGRDNSRRLNSTAEKWKE